MGSRVKANNYGAKFVENRTLEASKKEKLDKNWKICYNIT